LNGDKVKKWFRRVFEMTSIAEDKRVVYRKRNENTYRL
jgi:hypothetical protein